MGVIPTVLMAVGTGIQAISEIREGQQAANVYEYNAALARIGAKYHRTKGAIEQELHAADVARIKGRQNIIGGASGGAGQGADILLDTQTQADIDAAIMRFGSEAAAFRSESQAELFKSAGKEAKTAGFLTAGTTLLNSAGKFAHDNPDFFKTTSEPGFNPSRYRWSPRKSSGLGTGLRWSPRR